MYLKFVSSGPIKGRHGVNKILFILNHIQDDGRFTLVPTSFTFHWDDPVSATFVTLGLVGFTPRPALGRPTPDLSHPGRTGVSCGHIVVLSPVEKRAYLIGPIIMK